MFKIYFVAKYAYFLYKINIWMNEFEESKI